MAPPFQSIQPGKGRAFLIQIGNGVSPPTYTTLGGLLSNDYTINGNAPDITNKGSGGWRELLADGGAAAVTITGSGEFDENSAQFKALKLAAFNRSFIQAQIIDQFGDRVYGWWLVSQLKESGAQNGAQMWDITLDSTGAVAALITN